MLAWSDPVNVGEHQKNLKRKAKSLGLISDR